MRTLEQRRAANALDRAKHVVKLAERLRFGAEFPQLYRSYVDRLGPAIVMNGLGQALATELAAAGLHPKSASDRAHRELYGSLRQWLCRADGGVYPPKADLLHSLTNNGEEHYLHAHAEALAWLEWHKKCCRALFPGDGGRSG